jgi:hypothetical protein
VNDARRVQVEVAPSNAMGLAGHNAPVLLGRVDASCPSIGLQKGLDRPEETL